MSDTEKLFQLRAAQAAADDLVPVLGKACLRLEVAGGIRRLAPAVSRIDLVAIPKVEKMVAATPEAELFREHGMPTLGGAAQVEHNFLWAQIDGFFRTPQLTKRPDHIRTFAWPLDSEDQIPVRVTTCDEHNWGLIFLRATGSEPFVKHVHAALRVRGFVAKDGRIWHGFGPDMQPISDPLSIKEEDDVFRYIRAKFVPAVDRSW